MMFRAGVRRSLAVATLVGIGLASPVGATAPPRRAAAGPANFEAASREESAAVASFTAARARREQAQARVRQLDQEAVGAHARARQAMANVQVVEAAQRRMEAEVAATRLRLDAAVAQSRRTAAQMYKSVGSTLPPVVGALAHEGSLGDLARRQQYLRQAGDHTQQSLTAVRIARLDVEDAARTLARQRADAVAVAADADAEQARLAGLQAQQTRAVVTAVADEQREQALLVSARARTAEFERAARRQQIASGTVEQVLKARPNRGTGSRHFQFPADGPISSPFGWRVHPIFHTRRMHSGVDIGAGYGSSVRAGAAGTVAVAGVISGYGNAIVIDHGGGIATLYGHLSRFKVRVGQSVAAGETIGAVGNTGNSTGPHLHFEVRVQGVPVDPMPYL